MGLSGLLQGLTGFGFAIIAMAVLPLALPDFTLVFTIVALNSIIIPFLTMVSARKGMVITKGVILLSIGGMIGTYFGFHYMNDNIGRDRAPAGEVANADPAPSNGAIQEENREESGSNSTFIRVFGAVLIMFAVVDIILSRTLGNYRLPGWLGLPCGGLGGFFGGAFNIGGPPMVAYVYSQPWSKQQIVASLQIAFLFSTGYRIWLMGFNGYFDFGVAKITAYSLIPTALGVYVGGRFLERVDRTLLKTVVFCSVGVLGIKYLFFP